CGKHPPGPGFSHGGGGGQEPVPLPGWQPGQGVRHPEGLRCRQPGPGACGVRPQQHAAAAGAVPRPAGHALPPGAGG
ncbi:hypothetical protein HaLaN_07772, partial [Haematococcus lacustris]